MARTSVVRNSDVRTYPALFRRVKETLLEGQRRIEAEKVRTYWETGRLIQTHILQNKDRADYGAEVMARLADDLELNSRILYYCTQFFDKYPRLPILNARSKFTWTHFRELLKVADDKARSRLTELAKGNDWSARELASRIKSGRSAEDAEVSETIHYPLSTIHSADPLPPLQGTLYTYQVFRRKVLSAGTTELVLDLGFSNYRDVDQRLVGSFSAGDIVESRPKDDAYRFVKGTRTPKDLYTYQAFVEKVVDGDTLKVHIDLGFANWTRQTLRLRGIDCPEVGTKEGDAAKAFVQSYLKEADQVIIRSSKSDKYDRYLADVFIPQADGTDDIFLNNLLLEKGHAVRWAD
jgi:endonuclease YncB( thermonuclease family)